MIERKNSYIEFSNAIRQSHRLIQAQDPKNQLDIHSSQEIIRQLTNLNFDRPRDTDSAITFEALFLFGKMGPDSRPDFVSSSAKKSPIFSKVAELSRYCTAITKNLAALKSLSHTGTIIQSADDKREGLALVTLFLDKADEGNRSSKALAMEYTRRDSWSKFVRYVCDLRVREEVTELQVQSAIKIVIGIVREFGGWTKVRSPVATVTDEGLTMQWFGREARARIELNEGGDAIVYWLPNSDGLCEKEFEVPFEKLNRLGERIRSEFNDRPIAIFDESESIASDGLVSSRPGV